MRRTLSDRAVKALPAKAKRYAFPDPELRGFYVRVQPSGVKSFVAVANDPSGKQVWATVGSPQMLSIAEARESARTILKRIREGLPAVEQASPRAPSFEEIAEQWRTRHVLKNGLRSEPEITRLLRSHVYPKWTGREFLSIRRSDVTLLLDHVEEKHSARQADYVLNVVRSVMNWFATRHDDYVPPIVRGMQRGTAPSRARILADEEIRMIWRTAEAEGKFGAIVRLCLLTAQRRTKVVTMKWDDIKNGESDESVNRARRERLARFFCRKSRWRSSRLNRAWPPALLSLRHFVATARSTIWADTRQASMRRSRLMESR